jgi:site-specific recombinase XerD
VSAYRERGVFERPAGSGVWWINYRGADGRRHRQKIGPRRAAVEAYTAKIREMPDAVGAAGVSEKLITVRELALERMAYKKLHLAAGSHKTDRIRLVPLLAAFGELPAIALTPEMVDKFLAGIVESAPGHRGLTKSTANRYRSLLSSIYSLGVRNGRVPTNPCARVTRFKENPSRVRFLSEEEEAALRTTIRMECPEREPEFDLALHTGMRRGEQFGLKWENVDLASGILTVTGKTGRRHVPVNSVAKKALEILWHRKNLMGRLKTELGCPEFVCAEATHEGQRDWRRWFERCVKLAKIRNFRWHDLRHTFASRLVMSGVDIRSVQELLGHKSILMTMRYAHLSPGHQQANVEKLTKPKE